MTWTRAAPLWSLGWRGLTLCSRLLLVIAMARLLRPEDMGMFGLVAVTIDMGIYLLGADFYIHTMREAIQRPRNDWGKLLRTQAALALMSSAVALPIITYILSERVPMLLVSMALLLLVLEYCVHEQGRILVTATAPATASFVFFLRFGAWPPVAVGVMLVNPQLRSVETLLLAWATGCLLANIVAAWYVWTLGIRGWRSSVDWAWLRRGLKVALPFMLATIALRALFTFDRYTTEWLNGREALGAYVLFISIAATLASLHDAGVLSFFTPQLIDAHHKREHRKFASLLKRLTSQTVALAAGFAIVAVLTIGPFVNWLGQPAYADRLQVFHLLLAALALYVFSLIPHSALYAMRRDKSIIHSHVASLPIFAMSVSLVSTYRPDLAVAAGLCLAFSSILLWKTIASWRAYKTFGKT